MKPIKLIPRIGIIISFFVIANVSTLTVSNSIAGVMSILCIALFGYEHLMEKKQ